MTDNIYATNGLEKKNDNNKEVAAVISEIFLVLLLTNFKCFYAFFQNMLRPSKVLISVISFV